MCAYIGFPIQYAIIKDYTKFHFPLFTFHFNAERKKKS